MKFLFFWFLAYLQETLIGRKITQMRLSAKEKKNQKEEMKKAREDPEYKDEDEVSLSNCQMFVINLILALPCYLLSWYDDLVDLVNNRKLKPKN